MRLAEALADSRSIPQTPALSSGSSSPPDSPRLDVLARMVQSGEFDTSAESDLSGTMSSLSITSCASTLLGIALTRADKDD